MSARADSGPRNFRLNAAKTALLCGLAALLAGCISRPEVVDDFPTDYRVRHPIAIKERERAIEVFIGEQSGSLTSLQRLDIIDLAHRWQHEATGPIMIDVPSGTPNEKAAAVALREIRALLVSAGAPPRAIEVRSYRPASPAQLATIRLIYMKMAAEVGPCGTWPDDLGAVQDERYFANRPYWNLGCASQRQLAAMVDNPADLVQPRPETPPYAARRTTALDKYRKGESTATSYTDTNKGKISDVGQ